MAAQSAELKLRVSLDLTTLRRQLNSINTELGGQGITLPIKFDRQSIVKEFGLLNRYIGNKKFNVEVNTNLEAEIKNADRLVSALQRVQQAGRQSKGGLPLGIKALSKTESEGGFNKPAIQALFRAAIQGGLLDEKTLGNTRAQMVASLGGIGRDSIEGLLNGLNSGDAKLQAAAKSLGESLIASLKSVLGIASPSKETGRLGKFAAEGFEKGFVSGMVKAERQMAQSIRLAVVSAIREGLGNLPSLGGALVSFERQLAAGIQVAVRNAMRDGMSAAVLPGAKGGLLGGTGGAATGAAIGGAKALGGGIAGGMAKLTAGGIVGTAANLARYSIDNSAYQEFVGKLYQEIINSALSSGSQGAIIGALAVGGVAGGVGFARGAAGSLAVQAVTAIRNRILAALLAVPTGGLNNVVEVMVRDITSAIFQKTIRRLRAANAQLPRIDWPAVAPSAGAKTTATTMALPQGRAFAALPGSAFEAQKRLVGDILEPSLREILRNAANAFVDTVRQGMNNAVRSVNVRDLGTAARPMLGGTKVAGLLSAGVGRMPSTYAMGSAGGGVESRADMIARREREARRRSDLRAIDVMGGGAGRTPSPYSYTYRPTSSAIVPYALGGAMVPSGGGPRGGGGGGGGTGGGGPRGGGGGGGGTGGGGRFPSDGMLGPATLIGAGSQMEKWKTTLDIATASTKNFRASQIPLIGGIKSLAAEFGQATKQVLLYGTAYKGLAFITNLPGQVLNAAKSQQQFNNALQTATQDTGTFAKELLYVDNVQRAFGLNLETTRTGFTRLSASMGPAGFDSGSIEKLFTGISAATAALQLTPDKAERVIYAFGQMASKGQIMSEELKGQLGDVLPGALAIFAKAAGMSVKDFSKAMEDGVFIGGKFREVFAKVSDELMNRFGTGAQAAGKSLQGLLNTVQGDFRRTLESFSPLANAAAQSILGPLSGALKQLSMAAQVAMGEQQRVAEQLADAKATNANAQNIAALEARLRGLQEAARDPAIALQAKNIQSFVVEIGKAGNAVMNAAQAIGSVLNPLLTFLGTNLATVATLLISFAAGFVAVRLAITTALAVLTLFNVAVKALAAGTVSVNALSAAFRVLGVSAGAAQIGVVGLQAAMRVLLFSSGLGIAVGLLTAIATAAMGMGSAMKQAAQEARQAMQDMAQAAIVGNTALIQMRAATYKANISTLQAMKAEITKDGGRRIGKGGRTATVYDVNPIQRQILGAVPGVDLPQGPITNKQFDKALNDAEYMQKVGLQAATKFEQIAKINEAKLGLNKPQPAPVAPDAAGTGGSTKESSKAANDAKRLAEEIARQAMAASDALFSERQRLLILQQTNPTAKALVEYANQEVAIQRELNRALKEAKSEKEKDDQRAIAAAKRQINVLTLDQELARAREEAMKPLEDALRNQREQLLVEQDIKTLVAEGMVPERAKEVAEIRQRTRATLKQIDAQITALDKQIELARAAILERRAREGSTKAVQEMITALDDLEKRRKEAGEDKGKAGKKGKQAEQGVPTAPTETKSPLAYIQEGVTSAQAELTKLTNVGYQVAEAGKSIGSAFGQAFKDIASGAKSADQALSDAFASIASHFFDMAAQIITQMITMFILKSLIGLSVNLFGGGGGFSSNAAGFGGSFDAGIAPLPNIPNYIGMFAEGGFVTGPTQALIGEAGESEYVIPASKMRSAMNRYGAGARGSAVIPGNGEGDGGPTSGLAAMNASSIDVRYTVERINSVDYVTADQFRTGMAQAAQQGATQGEQRTLRRLQQSRATRSRLGMN